MWVVTKEALLYLLNIIVFLLFSFVEKALKASLATHTYTDIFRSPVGGVLGETESKLTGARVI